MRYINKRTFKKNSFNDIRVHVISVNNKTKIKLTRTWITKVIYYGLYFGLSALR